jgi:membrane-bound metal-dependent hydrolase YbcI (DUF457 family)
MDILTHAIAGTIIAAPFLPAAPLTASCFILGSVVPDADALSRVFGKVAFLRWHQTYTHSLPLLLVTTVFLWILVRWLESDETWAPVALGAGTLLHVAMDATNTYGVALLAPFSRRRYCTEWIFFVDAAVVAVNMVCLAVVLIQSYCGQPSSLNAPAAYGCFLVGYWTLRGVLYRRAIHLAPPGTRSLIPSAMIPWRFLGYSLHGEVARLFALSISCGVIRDLVTQQTFDSKYESLLNGVVEYKLMRELSPGYCTVEATEHDGTIELVCRDLRIRNFGGHFGRLDLTFGVNGKVERKVFHV